MSTARQSENTERITRSIESDLIVLAASTLIAGIERALNGHVSCNDPHFITQPTACLCISSVRRRAIAPQDNVRDHRAGMSDQPLQKHTQVRLRVHHIVIWRFQPMLLRCLIVHVHWN